MPKEAVRAAIFAPGAHRSAAGKDSVTSLLRGSPEFFCVMDCCRTLPSSPSARPSYGRWLAGARMLLFQVVEHGIEQVANCLCAGRYVLAAAAVGVNPVEERIVETKKALFHAAENIIDNSYIKCPPRLLHTRNVCEHTRLCDHHGGRIDQSSTRTSLERKASAALHIGAERFASKSASKASKSASMRRSRDPKGGSMCRCDDIL
jgi:hypothetical protein